MNQTKDSAIYKVLDAFELFRKEPRSSTWQILIWRVRQLRDLMRELQRQEDEWADEQCRKAGHTCIDEPRAVCDACTVENLIHESKGES